MFKLLHRLSLAIAISGGFSLLLASNGIGEELSKAASPYLAAHAHDDIKWQTWGPNSFEVAAREDKLIFLSIGYLSCHWCHKLAQDTFSDPRVSGILNDRYVAVLVDREARPDVDGYYMEIMQGMTGSQGWPANFVLTPEGIPLFATGYTTPDPSHGDPGLLPVLTALAGEWKDNRAAITKDVAITREQLKKRFQPQLSATESNVLSARDLAAKSWAQRLDDTYGGFGRSSKFPRPDVLLFLLDHGVRTRDEALLVNVYRTLDHMAAGGVRDQLGGAFHRYAVDRFWQVPHFEIMLSDNALLARLYLRAFQATKSARYGVIARQILDDLIERFRLTGGGFAAALGSHSEGKEGHYYTWTADEVQAVLGGEDAAALMGAYLSSTYGLADGRSILRLQKDPMSFYEVQKRFAGNLDRLRRARTDRLPPKRDEKVIVSWNALTASAFAMAAKVLDDAGYRTIARKTVAHLMRLTLHPDGLRHSYHKGHAAEAVFLDDYAFLIEALIDLYELDFDPAHLDHALMLMSDLVDRFQGPKTGLFFFSPKGSGSILPQRVVLREDGTPSGNAAALSALYRLGLFGDHKTVSERTRTFMASLGQRQENSLAASPSLLNAAGYGSEEAHEIVIVGHLEDPDTRRLLRAVYLRPLRSTVLSVIPPNAPEKNAKWALLARRPLLDTKPTAYLCKRRLCDLPVDSADAFAARLERIVYPAGGQGARAPTP